MRRRARAMERSATRDGATRDGEGAFDAPARAAAAADARARFERAFVARRDEAREAALALDDVLYFVNAEDNEEEGGEARDVARSSRAGASSSSAAVARVFVRRWSAELRCDDVAFKRVDWDATYDLNVVTHSVYEITIGQFSAKDRSDMVTTVRGRAYASPIWTELDDGGKPSENVESYPTIVFAFEDGKVIHADRGDMAYATVRRAASLGPNTPALETMSMFDHLDVDVVFSTHFALAHDVPPQRIGRTLHAHLSQPCDKAASKSTGRISPGSIFRSPARIVRRLIQPASPVAKDFRRRRAPDPGVEIYSAGAGAFVVTSLLAPAIDVVVDLAARAR